MEITLKLICLECNLRVASLKDGEFVFVHIYFALISRSRKYDVIIIRMCNVSVWWEWPVLGAPFWQSLYEAKAVTKEPLY